MLVWLVENAAITMILAAVVALGCRVYKNRPGLCHALWVLVLLRLVIPPLPVPSLTYELHLLGTDHWAEMKPIAPVLISQALPQRESRLANLGMEAEPAAASPAFVGADVTQPANVNMNPINPQRPVVADVSEARQLPLNGTVSEAILEPPRQIGIGAILLGIWLMGSILVLWQQLVRLRQFHRLVRHGEMAPEPLRERLTPIAAAFGLKEPPVRLCGHIASPMVWSLGRPVILWPNWRLIADMGEGDDPVLAHELAHLRRGDHWMERLLLICMVAFWWHPLYWLIRARIQHYAELACDAWAVEVFPAKRRAFAEALIDSVDPSICARPRLMALSVLGGERSFFKRRLIMIMKPEISPRSSAWRLGLALVAVCFFLPSWVPAPKAAPLTPDFSKALNLDQDIEPIARAAMYAHQGHRFMRSHSWDDAIDAFEKGLRYRADHPWLLDKLGTAQLKAGDYSGAERSFTKLINLDLKIKDAYLDRARARAGQSKTSGLDDLERAIGYGHLEAKDLVEDVFEPWFDNTRFSRLTQRALKIERLMARSGHGNDFSEKVEQYEQLLILAPNYGKALAHLGMVQLREGLYKDALTSFKRQEKMGYRVVHAIYNQACAQGLAGNIDAGMEKLERAVELGYKNWKHISKDDDLDPLRELPAFDQLMTQVKHEQFEELSSSVVNQLSAREQGNYFSTMGYHHYKANDLAAAAEAFKMQLKRSWDDTAEALYNLSCVHALQNQTELALDYLESSIWAGFHHPQKIRSDKDMESIRDLARFSSLLDLATEQETLNRFGARDWDHLRDLAEKRLAEKPESGKAYHHLGWVYLRNQDYEEAKKAFMRQVELGYAEKTAKYNLACVHANLGDTDEAFRWLNEAVDDGFTDASHFSNDTDLAALHEDSRFQELISRLKGLPDKHHDGSHSKHHYKVHKKVKDYLHKH